jgi:hypothetical protein
MATDAPLRPAKGPNTTAAAAGVDMAPRSTGSSALLHSSCKVLQAMPNHKHSCNPSFQDPPHELRHATSHPSFGCAVSAAVLALTAAMVRCLRCECSSVGVDSNSQKLRAGVLVFAWLGCDVQLAVGDFQVTRRVVLCVWFMELGNSW